MGGHETMTILPMLQLVNEFDMRRCRSFLWRTITVGGELVVENKGGFSMGAVEALAPPNSEKKKLWVNVKFL